MRQVLNELATSGDEGNQRTPSPCDHRLSLSSAGSHPPVQSHFSVKILPRESSGIFSNSEFSYNNYWDNVVEIKCYKLINC